MNHGPPNCAQEATREPPKIERRAVCAPARGTFLVRLPAPRCGVRRRAGGGAGGWRALAKEYQSKE